MNKGIRLYYYDTLNPLVFIHFWRKSKTPKNRFEIIWPLLQYHTISSKSSSRTLYKFRVSTFSWLNLMITKLRLKYVYRVCVKIHLFLQQSSFCTKLFLRWMDFSMSAGYCTLFKAGGPCSFKKSCHVPLNHVNICK